MSTKKHGVIEDRFSVGGRSVSSLQHLGGKLVVSVAALAHRRPMWAHGYQ